MHERDILLAAIEKELPAEREAYLREVCGDDTQMRSRIEALLRASEVADSFLEHPALDTEVLATKTDDGTDLDSEQHQIDLGFLQPPDGPNQLGRLGKYTITEVIGRGGMGVVLKGRDTQLERVVAIKVMAPELAANAAARKRFLREAHAVAAVSHDHVVTIFAIEAEKLPYLVMEYINGQSLQEKLDQHGPLELKEILRIGMQTAFGLAAAHAQGIVHRDIKPANILLQNGIERVQITDFGLARAADDVNITRTGEVAGTPQYMSPEQAQGLAIDARSDLFSLGVVLYAMCTGRAPFRADSTPAVLHRICHDTPRPIQEINSEIPQWLTNIIDRLLQKDPADRYSSAKEVAELLGQCLAHVQQPALVPSPEKAFQPPRPQSVSRFRQWPVAAIALLAVAVALSLTEASGVTKVMPTVIRIVRGEGTLVIEVDDPTVQVSLDGEVLSIRGAGLQELKLTAGQYRLHATKDGEPIRNEVVTISRNGRKVVTVTRESSGGTVSQSVSPAAEAVGDLKLLAKLDGHTDLVREVAFLPNGERMVSVGRDKMVRIWDLATRSILSTLPVEGYLRDADVSPDGRFVATAFTSSGKGAVIHVWDLEKRERRCELVQADARIECIRFSPDGTHVVTGGDPSGGVLWDLSTQNEVRRFNIDDPSATAAVEFSPDGRQLAIGAVGRLRLFEIESGNVVGDVLLPQPRGGFSLAFARNNKLLACGQMGGHISLVDVDHREVTTSLPNPYTYVQCMRFLDNNRFLMTTRDDAKGNATLQVWDVARVKLTAAATTERGTNKRLCISPNGRYAITAGGEIWDEASRSRTANGDYALRLWQLPNSVWSKESHQPVPARELPASAQVQSAAFVLQRGARMEEHKFDALAEAVLRASDDDIIEIRGNGPFITAPLTLQRSLTIRAGMGFRPQLRIADAHGNKPLLKSVAARLILEGIEFVYVGQEPRPPETQIAIVQAGGDILRVANCRFVRDVDANGPCIGSLGTKRAEVRNSEFLRFRKGNGISYVAPAQGTLLIENCVDAGFFTFVQTAVDVANGRKVSVHLRENSSSAAVNLQILPGRIPSNPAKAVASSTPTMSFEFTGNVFQAQGDMVRFELQQDPGANLTQEQVTAACQKYCAWRDDTNLYSNTSFLNLKVAQPVLARLEDWNRFWNLQSPTSSFESPKFQGGDLYGLAQAGVRAHARDFRLAEGSPGYRAGSNGKDLGADVDLVGPGEAYERWKKTPEYEQWLKEMSLKM